MKRLEERKPMDLKSVYERIFKGSMPALYEMHQENEYYYSSYVNTYLQRDIRELTQVGDEMAFVRFMTACAARTSTMVNYSGLAKEIDLIIEQDNEKRPLVLQYRKRKNRLDDPIGFGL